MAKLQRLNEAECGFVYGGRNNSEDIMGCMSTFVAMIAGISVGYCISSLGLRNPRWWCCSLPIVMLLELAALPISVVFVKKQLDSIFLE